MDADGGRRRAGHLRHRAGDVGGSGRRRGVPADRRAVAGRGRARRPPAAASGTGHREPGRGPDRGTPRRPGRRRPRQPAGARGAGHPARLGIRADRADPAGDPAGPGAAAGVPRGDLAELGAVQSRPHRGTGAGWRDGGGVRVPGGVRGERRLVPRGRGGTGVRAPGAASGPFRPAARLAVVWPAGRPGRAVLLGGYRHDRGGGLPRLPVHRPGPRDGTPPDPRRRPRGRADDGPAHHRPGRGRSGGRPLPRAARAPPGPRPPARLEPGAAPAGARRLQRLAVAVAGRGRDLHRRPGVHRGPVGALHRRAAPGPGGVPGPDTRVLRRGARGGLPDRLAGPGSHHRPDRHRLDHGGRGGTAVTGHSSRRGRAAGHRAGDHQRVR